MQKFMDNSTELSNPKTSDCEDSIISVDPSSVIEFFQTVLSIIDRLMWFNNPMKME